jgi:holin-like protein
VTNQLRGILLLTFLYLAGAFLAAQVGIGIPGAVLGLVLCLLAMMAVPRLQELIRPGALVMLGLVPLFLVPLLVRMALTLDFTTADTWLIVLAVAVATMVGIVATGLVAKFALGGDAE